MIEDIVSWVSASFFIVTSLTAIGIAIARLWQGRLTYEKNRLALITTILSNHANVLSEERIKGLHAVIDLIARNLIDSAPQVETDPFLRWQNKPLWMRRLILPKPRSNRGRIGRMLFYIYFWLGLFYLAFFGFVVSDWYPGSYSKWEISVLLAIGIVSITSGLVGRRVSLAEAKKKASLSEVEATTESKDPD